MSGPTREQVMAWAQHVGMAGMITDVVTTIDELERVAALAYAAGQAAERDARIAAQQELAECREAMTRAEHEVQRARGEIAAAVADEREACAKACEFLIPWFRSEFSSVESVRAAAIRARGQQ